ncbi:hypothetical protein [Nostoc commune]|uniref:hypothetical protein n=1 Tax=Nostoc commune TaxID=1178 RepID=UPI001FD4E70D|nr:hypothetical protein [Nostoc commune]
MVLLPPSQGEHDFPAAESFKVESLSCLCLPSWPHFPHSPSLPCQTPPSSLECRSSMPRQVGWSEPRTPSWQPPTAASPGRPNRIQEVVQPLPTSPEWPFPTTATVTPSAPILSSNSPTPKPKSTEG